MARRQCGELFASGYEEWVGADHERAGSQLDQGCEGRIEIAFVAGMQDMELQPEGAGRRLQVSQLWSRQSGLVGLTSSAMTVAVGTNSRSSSSRFGPSSAFKVTPVSVAARPVQAGDEAKLRPGRSPITKTIGIVVVAALAASAAGGAAARDDHGHLTADQIGRQCRQSIILTLRPAIFDRHILALDIAGFAQALAERVNEVQRILGDPLLRNPITGIAGCCARAASGHAPPRRRAA